MGCHIVEEWVQKQALLSEGREGYSGVDIQHFSLASFPMMIWVKDWSSHIIFMKDVNYNIFFDELIPWSYEGEHFVKIHPSLNHSKVIDCSKSSKLVLNGVPRVCLSSEQTTQFSSTFPSCKFEAGRRTDDCCLRIPACPHSLFYPSLLLFFIPDANWL